MARIDSFLRLVVEQSASDLHFHSGNPPIIRHDGDLVTLPFRTLSDLECRRFLTEIMSPEQRASFEKEQEIDFVYSIPEVGRFRANVFTQAHGVGGVFRVIPAQIPSLDHLQIPPVLKKLADSANGLVLVTGPTGSGKTTTLAAAIDYVNRTSKRHIITIEDPIEFLHTPAECVITQRQVGMHAESFASALRSALRESPDVVVVGEMRDLETINLALSAAETGVLVFGTLHSNSAAKAVDRIIDAFAEEQQDQIRAALSVLLKGVVAQQLCKRATGEGRVAAFEVLLQTYAVSHMIREGKTHQIEGYLQSVENDGSGIQSLDTCLLRFIREGLVSLDEAIKLANNQESVRRLAAELVPEE
jgi:twitching motility protein PilT